MNGADDCPSSLSQRLHEGNDLEAGRAVQTAGMLQTRDRKTDALFNLNFCWDHAETQVNNILPGGLIKEHDRGIVDQLKGDSQPFTLAPREIAGPCLSTFQETQSSQDLIYLRYT